MRLRELKFNIERVKKNFKYSSTYINNDTSVQIKGLKQLNSLINEIIPYGFIEQELNELEKDFKEIRTQFDDEVILKTSEFKSFEMIMEHISRKINAVYYAISNAINEQNENTISIKLPPFTDLKSVGKFIDDIGKIFKGVLPDKKQGEIKFTTFDTGSNWIEIALSHAESIVIIGEFIKITLEFSNIFSSYQTARKQLETSASESINDEAKRTVLRTMKILEEEQGRLCAEKLLSTGVIDTEELTNLNEYKSSVTQQIITMADYLSKGAEVRPALNAPREQVEEFPTDVDYQKIQLTSNQLFLNNPEKVEDETSIDKEIY